MVFALWSIDTNNLVASFDNQHDALALVMEGIRRNGIHSTDTLSLDAEDQNGDIFPIAYGHELAALAQREFTDTAAIAV